jgi:hypothetical protein
MQTLTNALRQQGIAKHYRAQKSESSELKIWVTAHRDNIKLLYHSYGIFSLLNVHMSIGKLNVLADI